MKQKIINKILKIKSKYQSLILVFIILMEIIFGILFYVNYYNDEILKKNINVRSISLIISEEKINDIRNVEYVENVYENWIEVYLKDIGNINYYGILGTKLKLNEVLVSELSDYNIGDMISFKYNDKYYNFKVVGYYDSKLGIRGLVVNHEEIALLSRKVKNSYKIIVDDYDNLEDVFRLLQDRGFEVSIINTKGIEMLEKSQMIIHLMIIFVIIMNILIFGVLVLIVKDIMLENKKNFAIMKVVGYKNKNITSYTIKSIWSLMWKDFVIASFLVGVIGIIIWRSFEILKILIITYLIVLILLLGIVVINKLYIFRKIKKVYPIILYKE